MRDYGTVSQLICLSNIENLNAHFITENIPQSIRLQKLNQIAIHQMSILQQSEIQLVNNTKLQVRSKKNKYE